MVKYRQAQRWHGYMNVVVQTPEGRTPAHILEFSRTGGLVSTEHAISPGQNFQILVNVDRAYEQLVDAPDVIVLEATAQRGDLARGSFGSNHTAFSFPTEFVAKYWPWLDTIAPHHGMRPAPPSTAPPRS